MYSQFYRLRILQIKVKFVVSEQCCDCILQAIIVVEMEIGTIKSEAIGWDTNTSHLFSLIESCFFQYVWAAEHFFLHCQHHSDHSPARCRLHCHNRVCPVVLRTGGSRSNNVRYWSCSQKLLFKSLNSVLKIFVIKKTIRTCNLLRKNRTNKTFNREDL